MEQLELQDALEDGGQLDMSQGFSKEQILQFSFRDIDDLHLMEHPLGSAADKEREEEIQKKEQGDYKEPNEGGPRPPKEEEYPDDEDEDKDDLLSEVSDPNKKD